MTKYSDFENNKEVTDVLFCIVLGHSNVKQMIKTLKQPQSTISTKLQFLRKNKVIIKKKWIYEPNWKRIYQIMYKILKEDSPIALQLYVKSFIRKAFKIEYRKIKQLKNLVKNIKLYFPEKRLKKMMESYAELFMKGYPKASISNISSQYLIGLIESDENEIKDDKLIELKRILGSIKSKETRFFQFAEK